MIKTEERGNRNEYKILSWEHVARVAVNAEGRVDCGIRVSQYGTTTRPCRIVLQS